jgi:signal transduction histidine kinase/CheY-like chemotaxis protein
MRDVSLRRRLVALTAAGILPLAIMAGIGLYVLDRQQDAQARQVGLELARSVRNAVDTELRGAIQVLEALATTPILDRGDLSGFLTRAQRLLALRPEWAAIVLADRAGAPLVDTRSVEGGDLSETLDRESFDRLVRTRSPAVGSLTWDGRNAWLFAVRVPVLRDGVLKYVVTALVKPAAIRGVLARQHVPDDWVISIVDASGVRVARSRAHEENLGGRLSETVQQVVDGGDAEGFGMAYALEGERIFTPYSRLPTSGWIAVLGIPTALLDRAAYRSLAVYGGGVLLSLALGILSALWLARSIARPMAELRVAAEALGRREPPRPPETAIREIREVGAALSTAADAIARGEAEREELLRRERQARDAAEKADRAKDEFMAVLSHELRTPLSAVFGWARLLQGGHRRDQALVARATDAIVRNAEVQVQLIDDLLDLARITKGKMRLEVGPVEIHSVLQGALDAVRPAAEGKGIRIETVIDPSVGAINGDAARLQQVVWNLLMNAVKFTPRGGRVTLHAQRVSAHLRIAISDTGQGIAPDVLPHVFERFRQGDSSSTRTHGGLGLGLALVKHLVELHGGTVVAQSAGQGHGATFVVMLPTAVAEGAAESPAPVHASAAAVAPETPVVRLDGLRVLVADDDGEAVALAETVLAGAGASVCTCLSAAGALDLLQRWRPDVLVSDIEMPGEDGYSLIRRVRALAPDAGGDTPAIALTAYGRSQDRLRAVVAGFTMHVRKPVDPGELTAIVAGVARRRESWRAT